MTWRARYCSAARQGMTCASPRDSRLRQSGEAGKTGHGDPGTVPPEFNCVPPLGFA